MNPVFTPLRQVSTYEATFEVSGAPMLEPRPGHAITPRRVTVCYTHAKGRWLPTAVEITGSVPGRLSPLVARFTSDPDFDPPGWDAATPGWALELVERMAPTQIPG